MIGFYLQFGREEKIVGAGYINLALSDNSAPYKLSKISIKLWENQS